MYILYFSIHFFKKIRHSNFHIKFIIRYFKYFYRKQCRSQGGRRGARPSPPSFFSAPAFTIQIYNQNQQGKKQEYLFNDFKKRRRLSIHCLFQELPRLKKKQVNLLHVYNINRQEIYKIAYSKNHKTKKKLYYIGKIH